MALDAAAIGIPPVHASNSASMSTANVRALPAERIERTWTVVYLVEPHHSLVEEVAQEGDLLRVLGEHVIVREWYAENRPALEIALLRECEATTVGVDAHVQEHFKCRPLLLPARQRQRHELRIVEKPADPVGL